MEFNCVRPMGMPMKQDLEEFHFDGTLIVHNLITDEDDPVTAFAVDWIEAFSKIATSVIVISTHVGRFNFPVNVKVIELGGGSIKRKLVGSLRLIKGAFMVLRIPGNKVVFHHMSEKTACFIGPIYKAAHMKQGLWYSHNRQSRILNRAIAVVDDIFSPTLNSFPVPTKKLRAVGHGINMSRFHDANLIERKKSGVLALGRISRVKNLEKIIVGLSLTQKTKPSLTFIGPLMETPAYLELLKSLAFESQVDLRVEKSVNYQSIPDGISKFSMTYSGSPNTVDKSVLEAAATGSFILSENKFVLELTGMDRVWDEIGTKAPLEITSQIELLESHEGDVKLRKLISKVCIENNDVNQTVAKILNVLTGHES
jgi:glycosyltransferase involved in cell wall biosynthesis